MKEGKGQAILLTIIAIATLLVAVVGATFAYFTATLNNNETTTSVKVISGTIGTVFVGGADISKLNLLPDNNAFATKTFTIKYTSSTSAGTVVKYTLGLVINENTFATDSLKYKFSVDPASTVNGSYSDQLKTALTNIPTTGTLNLGEGSFLAPTVGEASHIYNLELYFPETDIVQNEDQGTSFKAHVSISQPLP